MAEPGTYVGELVLTAVLAPYMSALLVLMVHRADWRVSAWTGVAGLLVSAVSSIVAFMAGMHYQGEYTVAWMPSLGIYFSLRLDFLSLIMGVVVSVLSLLIGIYSVEYIGSWGAPRYWVFFTFFVGSMMLLVFANDLFTLLVGWEGTGLASYALISFYYDDRESDWVGDPGRKALGVPMWSPPTHSGIRAIVFTRLADAAMLLAIGLIHYVVGSTYMGLLEPGRDGFLKVVEMVYSSGILVPFIIAFYLGALAKSAQFPFHEWLVTAMTGPAPVSALIHAATMVKAGVYFALRFTPWLVVALASAGLASIGGMVMEWLLWVALLTAFMLASMAVVARELKLILAYSTASQLSYMFAAVFAAAVFALTHMMPEEVLIGVYGGLSHLVSHAVFKAAMFLCAGALIHAVHSRYITDMGGLRKHMPLTFTAMLLAGLSLAALPPFSGWWSKDAAVYAISLSGKIATIMALVTAVLTAAYTVRMILYVFTRAPHDKEVHGHEPSVLMWAPYLVLGIASIGLGLAWYPFIEYMLAEGIGVHVKLNVALMVIGTVSAIVGAGLGSVYLLGFKPWELIEANSFLRALHSFLYDRWYINALIYRLIVYPGHGLAHGIKATIEYAIDTGYHSVVPRLMVSIGRIVRSIQVGDVRSYLWLYFIGLIVLGLLAYYLVIGVMGV